MCGGKKVLYQSWQRLMEQLSTCSYTFLTDKVSSIAGMAQVFQKATGDNYLAGHWQSHLASSLLWKVEPLNGVAESREELSQIPSWSSLSYNGAIAAGRIGTGATIRLGSGAGRVGLQVNKIVKIVESTSNPFGDVATCEIYANVWMAEIHVALLDPGKQNPHSWSSQVFLQQEVAENVLEGSRSIGSYWPDSRAEHSLLHSASSPLYCILVQASGDRAGSAWKGLVARRQQRNPQVYRRIGYFDGKDARLRLGKSTTNLPETLGFKWEDVILV